MLLLRLTRESIIFIFQLDLRAAQPDNLAVFTVAHQYGVVTRIYGFY